jgi:hypothetical protein
VTSVNPLKLATSLACRRFVRLQLLELGLFQTQFRLDGAQRGCINHSRLGPVARDRDHFFITTDDGLSIPEADTSLELKDALADVSSVQDIMTDALAPAAPLQEWQNKPYDLSDEELAALGLTAEGVAQSAVVDVTPSVLAAAIEASVKASMARVNAMPQSDDLDLGAMWGQASTGGDPSGMNALDTASTHDANVVHLRMADVLSLPANNGVHQLMLTGPAHDQLVLSKGEWTDTGMVVNQDGHTYAVYTGSNDASAQLLIDQQMLQSLVSN